MFENKTDPVISKEKFALRLGRQLLIVLMAVVLSIVVGMVGYRYFESMQWIDAFLNTSMLLGGMGEIDSLKTDGGKIFASVYAIYSGMFMLVCGGLLLAPVFHRILHHFHEDSD